MNTELVIDKMDVAEFVEFNMLYSYNKLKPELEALESDFVEEGRRKDQIYSNGKFRRYIVRKTLKVR